MNTLPVSWCKKFLLYALIVCCLPNTSEAQYNIVVDLALLDGLEITPDNVFNYQVMNNSNRRIDAIVRGTLKYKNTTLRFSYSYRTTLETGINRMSKENVSNPKWDFSDNAFKELFLYHKKLPQGTYEYCVEIDLNTLHSESHSEALFDACIYQSVDDIFLINLIDPEDDAKIYEMNPMLSWAVNHPIASQLNYKLRLVELKENQNNVSAITRNNPIFQEKGLLGYSLIYPVTARSLKKYQPYVWTVDAYYKHILLGGAEPWRFTIIEDTLLKEIVTNQSYYEFENHIGDTRLNATGEIKLKYRSDIPNDTLAIRILSEKGDDVSLKDNLMPMKNGYNWFTIKLHERVSLKHMSKCELEIRTRTGELFIVPFMYYNPLFVR